MSKIIHKTFHVAVFSTSLKYPDQAGSEIGSEQTLTRTSEAGSVGPQNNACRIEHGADLVTFLKLKIFKAIVGYDDADHVPP